MTVDRIYSHIQQHPKKPHSVRELSRNLRLDKDEVLEALELLVAQGKLTQPKRKLFQLPELSARKGFEGRVQAHPAGFAFVVPTNPDLPDLFIPKGHTGGAWNGDLVWAEPKPAGRDGKPWGVIVEVMQRSRHSLTGHLYFTKGFAWLRPDDNRLGNLKLQPDGLENLEAGARIAVRVEYPSAAKKGQTAQPFGVFERYLGQGDSPEVETEAVIAKFELHTEFPPEALSQAERVAKLEPSALQGRTDFRKLRVFTIDGADAKDFDDAIHIQTLEGGHFEVGIHIADVSHYVQEFSPLDQAAFDRATSAYLPGRVLPMLPEQLSNHICSLVPGQDRLVLSVVLELNPSGKVKRYKFHQGVIHSVARLTYEAVEAFAESKIRPTKAKAPAKDSITPPSQWSPELQHDLRLLLELTQTLKARRLEKGALDFHFTEVKVEVDAEGNLHLKPQHEPKARSLIEELMLLANRTVAQHLTERSIPALYRVHEDPSEQSFSKAVRGLEKMGYRLPGGEPSPKALQTVINQSQGKPEAPAVSTLILRSLRLARYAAENLGHFGLAAEHYLHFTSPIRRYPDLVVHRVLRTLLNRKLTPKLKADWAERFPKMAEHTSERERAAENAERDLTKYYQALWAERHKGQSFKGVVSGVTGFGVFVALDNGVEGMVRLGALEDDHYHYHEDLLALEGLRSKRRIRMGDAMEIQIQGGNPSARQIDFVPVAGSFDKPTKTVQPNPTPKGKPDQGQRPAKAENRSSKAQKDPAKGSAKSGSASVNKGKSRRVVGPPDAKKGFTKPVRAKVGRIFFGDWSPEATAPSPSEAPKPGRGRNRRRRKKS